MPGDAPRSDRRSVLVALAGALAGAAGCVGPLQGQGSDRRQATVSLLAAGSLNNALEHGLRPGVDATLQVEARGSAEVARLVASGGKDPDIVSVADVALFDGPLWPAWFAEFATNSLVLAYDAGTDAGRRLADAGRDGWYRPLLDGDVALGRTDPDTDPLGYRTLFMLELATEYYGTGTDLRETVPSRDQLYPETQLVSQFETGAVEAAVTYRNMAVERGYDYVDLPDAVDLGDPAHADAYASATYDLPGGKTVAGAPIRYGSTIRSRSPVVVDVFDEHTTGSYLNEFGLVVPDDYPRFTGDVPDELTN